MSACEEFRPVVVTPTYNNARTLWNVLERTAALGLQLIVVDDGSTDDTARLLAEFSRGRADVCVLTHARNRGKAAALRTGFAAAAERGFTHAATLDTDGQLDPEQVPALLELARTDATALVVGYRDDTASDYPARSRVGRRVSNLLVHVESGLRVQDSQCGLRVYPLGLVRAVRCRAGRFAFETEILTRAGWAGCTVLEASVNCRYLAAPERVSHFRPWVDSLRGARMHVRLLARALCPWPHKKWPACSEGAAGAHPPLWRSLLEWLNPLQAWRQLREGEFGRLELATAVALGVFIANLPLYGLQTLLALYSARRLHLHPLPVVVGSQVSTPPVGPALIVAAIGFGHLLLHRSLPTLHEFDVRHLHLGQILGPLLLEWTLGAVFIGVAMAAAAFALTLLLFRFVRPESVVAVAADPEQRVEALRL